MLTDNKIADLYLRLFKNYSVYKNNGDARPVICEKLLRLMQIQLTTPPISEYTLAEKLQVLQIMDIFFNTIEDDQGKLVNDPYFAATIPCFNSTQNPNTYTEAARQEIIRGNELNLFANYYYYRMEENIRPMQPEAIFFISVFMKTLGAIVSLGFIAGYLIPESVERIYYNEGRRQGLVNLTAMGITGVLTALYLQSTFQNDITAKLGIYITYKMLFNAWIVGMVINGLQTDIAQKQNQDAIDRMDPERFMLTDSEERNLLRQNYNIYKVKCCITVYRYLMGPKGAGRDLTKFFQRSEQSSKYLEKIRALKQGTRARLGVNFTSSGFRVHIECYNSAPLSTAASDYLKEAHYLENNTPLIAPQLQILTMESFEEDFDLTSLDAQERAPLLSLVSRHLLRRNANEESINADTDLEEGAFFETTPDMNSR